MLGASGCTGKVTSVPQEVAASAAVSQQAAEQTTAPDMPQSPKETTVPPEAVQDVVTGSEEPASPLTGYAEAIALVLENYPGAVPVGCFLEQEPGGACWEVKVLTSEHQTCHAQVDARTGQLLSAVPAAESSDLSAEAAYLPFETAVASSPAAEPGSILHGFELLLTSSGPVYEITVETADHVEIITLVDALTGAVLDPADLVPADVPGSPASVPAAAAGNGHHQERNGMHHAE